MEMKSQKQEYLNFLNSMKNLIITIFLIIIPIKSVFGQGFLINESNNIQAVNPSYYAFNFESRVGVIYNSINYDGIRNIDTKYAFSGYSFENLNFSLGLDFSSFNVSEFGYTENQLNLTYVYKLNLNRRLFILPSIYMGVFNRKIDASNYIFEDQILLSQGILLATSNDPLLSAPQSNNSFDIGIGALVYNENFMVGLSAKHINMPQVSLNTENYEKRELSISVQGVYEMEINRLDQSFLPRHSYLFLYSSATKTGDIFRFYFSQELQLNSFKFGIHQKLSQLNDFSLVNLGLNTGMEAGNINFNATYSYPIKNRFSNVPSIFELSIQFNFEPWLSRNRLDYKRLRTFNY
jgi:hypothetical protein